MAELEINDRVAQAQLELKSLEGEIKMLKGKISNRDAEILNRVKNENAELRKRAEALYQAVFSVSRDAYRPRDLADAKLKSDTLRLAALEYCKSSNLDSGIWKSIES